MAFIQPNLFVLSSPGIGGIHVTYTTTGFDGKPHFTYSCLPCHLHANGFQPQ